MDDEAGVERDLPSAVAADADRVGMAAQALVAGGWGALAAASAVFAT